MLKVGGLLQSACRMWDTPGVPHHHQLSSKLNADEVRHDMMYTEQHTKRNQSKTKLAVAFGCDVQSPSATSETASRLGK